MLSGVDDPGGVTQHPDDVGKLDDLGPGAEHDRDRLWNEGDLTGHATAT